MRQPDFSTTRNLIKEKPACFDSSTEGLTTLLKTPDNEHKIAEGGLRLKGFYKSSNEEKPLVTVVTVVYNGAEYLEDTIKSVIEQTYDNVEYIIVDGGSTDGTLETIKKYEDAIDYWVSEPDKGIYDAMNKGIDLGSGKWINFMNAGDLFFNLEVFNEIAFNEHIHFNLIYGDKKFKGVSVKALPVENIEFGIIHACHQSMFFSLDFLKLNLFYYNVSYRIYADYDLVARLYKFDNKMHYLNMPISVFQGGGVSSAVSWQKRYDKYHSILKNFGFFFLIKSLIKRFSYGSK